MNYVPFGSLDGTAIFIVAVDPTSEFDAKTVWCLGMYETEGWWSVLEFTLDGKEATVEAEFAKPLVNEFAALETGIGVQEGGVEFHAPFGWQ